MGLKEKVVSQEIEMINDTDQEPEVEQMHEKKLTNLRVFSLSLPVYDPNRAKLHPREVYALVHFFGNGHRGLLALKVLSEQMLELYLKLIVLIRFNFQALALEFKIINRYQVLYSSVDVWYRYFVIIVWL